VFKFKIWQGCIILTNFFLPIPLASAQPSDCQNPTVQAEMNRCASLDAEAADRKLNQIYKQLRSKYKGTKKEKLLIDAQLAWIKFRDTNCAFALSKYEGGSIASMMGSNCLKRTTEQRTEELESYLKGMEGGGF
jgi:uncharacterized protein YecT (DUF1311 family)